MARTKRQTPQPRRRQDLRWPERLDIRTVDLLTPLLGTRASKALGSVGKLADEPPLLALSPAVLAAGLLRDDARLRRAGERMLLAHLAATAMKTFGKDHVDRSRPAELMEEGTYRMAQGQSDDPALRSFPSGHTAGAVAVARAFAREYPQHALPAYLAAALLGALQLPRLAHFPTDILAGALVGIAAEEAVEMGVG